MSGEAICLRPFASKDSSLSFYGDCRPPLEPHERERFHYDDLLREDQIRIIELFPGAEGDTIRCSLISELRRDTADSYDAVS